MNKFAFVCFLMFTLPLMGQVATAEDSARDVLQYNESFVERDAPTTDITVMSTFQVEVNVCGYDDQGARGDCESSTATNIHWFQYNVAKDAEGNISGMGDYFMWDVENRGAPHYVDLTVELCWKTSLDPSKVLCLYKDDIYQDEDEKIATHSIRSDTYFVRVEAHDEYLYDRDEGGDETVVRVTPTIISSTSDMENPRILTGQNRVDAKVCHKDCETSSEEDPVDVFAVEAFQGDIVSFRFGSREYDFGCDYSVYVYAMNDYYLSTYDNMTYYRIDDCGKYDSDIMRITVDYSMPKSGLLYVWFQDRQLSNEQDPDSYTIRLNGIDTSSRQGDADRDGDGMTDVEEARCGSSFYDANDVAPDADGDGFCDAFVGDDDGDGVLDEEDNCPNTPPSAEDYDSDGCEDTMDTDVDNDGVLDIDDACPLGELAWISSASNDQDGDGCLDASEDLDDDNDGWSDLDETECGSSSTNNTDVPSNFDEVLESGNRECDAMDVDDDEDGTLDVDDDCQFSEHWVMENQNIVFIDVDTDGDGCFNDIDNDLDDDGDGIPDSEDNCPVGLRLGSDVDNDGCKDSEDGDTDGDSFSDYTEDECGSDKNVSTSFPEDFDNDGDCDLIDLDDDNDGVADTGDWAPLDASETRDTDGDGVGDNADQDADGDGVYDENDAFPLDDTESKDLDNDGIGDNSDLDLDGDGWSNTDEITCGTDKQQANSIPTDTNNDGECDAVDDDDDGDDHSDIKEKRCGSNPLDSSDEPDDHDGDGLCNEDDQDSDDDGIIDDEDDCDFSEIGLKNTDADDDNDGCWNSEDQATALSDTVKASAVILVAILLGCLAFGFSVIQGRKTGADFAKSGVSQTTVINNEDNSVTSISHEDNSVRIDESVRTDNSRGDSHIESHGSSINTGSGSQSNKK